jgi:ferredoxin
MAHVDLVSKFADKATVWPQDEQGFLDLASICEDDGTTALYCCGPEPLLNAVEAACEHWPPDRVRMERFVAPDAGDAGDLVAFEVELSNSGITLQIPADRSIMDVATDAGVKVPRSCTEGLCGSCETVVLEGVPLHRDSVLTPEERDSNETLMVCVSRARTPRLVLEL